jgi:hypothetical protein
MAETNDLAADLESLRNQKATWQTDGKGIRGDATVVKNTVAKLDWGDAPVQRRANHDL